jgi:hypothetical protein
LVSRPRERRGLAIDIDESGVWLSLEEAAVLLGLLELLSDPRLDGRTPELDLLLERWQSRLGARMSEAMTGLGPDGFDTDSDERG